MNQLAETSPGGTITSSESWNPCPRDVKPSVKGERPGLAVKGATAALAQYVQGIQGQEEQNIHLKQSGWCRYVGQAVSHPCNIWLAALSKAAAEQVRQQHLQQEQPQPQQQRQRQPLPESDRQHPYDLLQQAHFQITAPSYSQQPAKAPSHQSLASCRVETEDCSWAAGHEQRNPLLSDRSAQELAELLDVNRVDDSLSMPAEAGYGWSAGSWQHQQGMPDTEHNIDHAVLARPGSATQCLSTSAQTCSQHYTSLPADCKARMYGGLQHESSAALCHEGLHGMHQQIAAPLYAGQPWFQEHSIPHMQHHSSHLPRDNMYRPPQAGQDSSKLGMGRYAMEAAAGGAYMQPPGAQQANHQDWLLAAQMRHARSVRPCTQRLADMSYPNQLPNNSVSHVAGYPAADNDMPGRSHSEDMTRHSSIGTSAYPSRAGSGGLAASQQDTLGLARASSKSSLGSSLPNMTPRSPVAQGGRTGSTSQIMQQFKLQAATQATAYPAATQPVVNKLLMQLVTAPAMFSGPICPGKRLEPPFRVRVALLAESCIQLQLTLKAYVLSKDHLNSLEQWHPAKHVVTEGIAGGEVRQTISCTETGFGDAEGSAELLGGTSDFVFTELRFSSSSRMKPRWLAIVATLPTQDIIFVLYNVPTIIMSRACDQLEKAIGILRGAEQRVVNKKRTRNNTPLHDEAPTREDASGPHSPSVPSSSSTSDDADNGLDWSLAGPFTYRRWHRVVERKYNAFNLVRALDPEDLAMMERVAGFHDQASARKPSGILTERQWAFFGEWYLSYLRIFRCHQQLWMMERPRAICGFGVDRLKAEQLLAGHPLGTFLVRPGLTLARCMVISAVIDGGIIKHLALDGSQLDATTIETWVKSVYEAQELLDYKTAQRYNKAKVFCMHYQSFGQVSDDLSQQTESVC